MGQEGREPKRKEGGEGVTYLFHPRRSHLKAHHKANKMGKDDASFLRQAPLLALQQKAEISDLRETIVALVRFCQKGTLLRPMHILPVSFCIMGGFKVAFLSAVFVLVPLCTMGAKCLLVPFCTMGVKCVLSVH